MKKMGRWICWEHGFPGILVAIPPMLSVPATQRTYTVVGAGAGLLLPLINLHTGRSRAIFTHDFLTNLPQIQGGCTLQLLQRLGLQAQLTLSPTALFSTRQPFLLRTVLAPFYAWSRWRIALGWSSAFIREHRFDSTFFWRWFPIGANASVSYALSRLHALKLEYDGYCILYPGVSVYAPTLALVYTWRLA